MPIVMGTNLKKKQVHIDKYGNVKEGSIYQDMGHNLGATASAGGLPEESTGTKETQAK